MVSCVVKVLLATMMSVVSGFRLRSVLCSAQASGLLTKCTRTPVLPSLHSGARASAAMRGPRSEPPMPMFTTSVMARPVLPLTSPERTRSAKAQTRCSSACTSC